MGLNPHQSGEKLAVSPWTAIRVTNQFHFTILSTLIFRFSCRFILNFNKWERKETQVDAIFDLCVFIRLLHCIDLQPLALTQFKLETNKSSGRTNCLVMVRRVWIYNLGGTLVDLFILTNKTKQIRQFVILKAYFWRRFVRPDDLFVSGVNRLLHGYIQLNVGLDCA